MFEQPAGKEEKDRSRLIMILSGVAVLAVIGLIILVTSVGSKREQNSEMARPGSTEFDSYAPFIKINIRDMRTGERLGNKYARILCSVENTGDRVLTGLQLRGMVLNLNFEMIKDKIITPIPRQRDELPPKTSLDIDLNIEPVPGPDELSDMKVELYALKLEEK